MTVKEWYKWLLQKNVTMMAGQALLRCIKYCDRNITEVMSLRLDMTADDPFLLPSITILVIGMEFIWGNR